MIIVDKPLQVNLVLCFLLRLILLFRAQSLVPLFFPDRVDCAASRFRIRLVIESVLLLLASKVNLPMLEVFVYLDCLKVTSSGPE